MTGFACPDCGATSTLYENVSVPGWRALQGTEREVEWEKATPSGGVGCSCTWEGSTADLRVLGTDGEPLPEVHPEQTALL